MNRSAALAMGTTILLASCFDIPEWDEYCTDHGYQTTYYRDTDGDGWGDAAQTIESCDSPPNAALRPGDCDDTDTAVYPGAEEVCNGQDDDCDGEIDETFPSSTWYRDEDGDGYGTADTLESCAAPDGYAPQAGDCDDTDPATYPGAQEVCDDAGTDEDCDGLVDDEDPSVDPETQIAWYPDQDGDGYGNSAYPLSQCSSAALEGYVAQGGDCEDGSSVVYPGAEEYCNGVDDDCDAEVDEGFDRTTYFLDNDGDGWGDSSATLQACAVPPHYVVAVGDCDDGDDTVYPWAPELCDGLDNDCDGQVDEYVTATYYPDRDGDGYGDPMGADNYCDPPTNYVSDHSDCNDADPDAYPGAKETCNDLDDDCDGRVDEDVKTTFCRDQDADGYGTDSDSVNACSAPSGFAASCSDCDDSDPFTNPGALERPSDGIDNDCDGIQSVVVQLSAGTSYALALDDAGVAWAWGNNAVGQLGDGTTSSRTMPVPVIGLSGVQAVSAASAFSFALLDDGSVWAWGDNYSGELGDGTTVSSSVPVPVKNLVNASPPVGGFGHSLALTTDATVYAWGSNGYGQLGSGNLANSALPIQVSDLAGVVAVAAGGYHSLAVLDDGTVYGWGANNNGQLGDGTTVDSGAPVPVTGLGDAQSIAAGAFFSLALLQDGTVWGWGNNYQGQLGDGTTVSTLTPVSVTGLENVDFIAAGAYFSLALVEDGTIWAWGQNSSGQLGDGTTASKSLPVMVDGLTNVRAIAAGDYHTLALLDDGTVLAWGANESGQLGDGTTDDSTTPVDVLWSSPRR